ncbi:chromosome segregation protein [Mycoplasma testudineum]|uniref:Chromosome partition protein Smc n=1 Tax=Mycoplasma testudineum TaxID=244584 RepID=A0A4R6ICD9_9MOLU|nr:AAA family ATPase [Mycoplasma testudineum]OYD26777.1 ABC transporter ATP-binding protein [Mycoplasma testudineum]TDO19913.1 chromosome segregation protein [Mycoplasma testudineum]
MKLKKIYAHGFKSFADPIQLTFDGGVVGIVGPNGSGKSNINDAIKWVLGEQSSKSLRGENMEDVIFGGSKKVTEMKKAIVTLTFDNSEGLVSLPHKTITITRELERGEGKNKYYINDELVRYRDIKDIVLESGISKSSLAIISQGTVSDIAEATPESRRLIFEEAAGVSKYKFRKTEALRKLEKTQESLNQIQVVIKELDRQLKPLRAQADKAKIYLEKARELKAIEVGVLVHNLNFYKEKIEEYNQQLEGVQETKDNLEAAISNSSDHLSQATRERLDIENEIQDTNSRIAKIEEGLSQLQIVFAQEEKHRELIISGDLKASSEQKKEALVASISSTKTTIDFYQKEANKLQSEINDKKEAISQLDKSVNDARITQAKEHKRISEAKTRISILEDHKKNKTNYFKGVKTITENSNIFKGYFGLVVDLLKIPKDYALAVEAVLGNTLQHIVVKDSDVAVQAINFLKQNDGGRATFIPIKSISEKVVRREHLMALSNVDGYLGLASELVSVDNPELEILSKFLLGNIIVTENIEAAKNIDALLSHRYMIVTLYGDIIRSGGVMTGGTPQADATLIGIDDQIQKLKDAIPEMDAIQKRLENQIMIDDSKRKTLQTLISELTVAKTKYETNLQNEEINFAKLKSQYEAISSEKLELKESTEVKTKIQALQSEKVRLSAQRDANSARVKILNQETFRLESEKSEYQKSLIDLEKAFSKVIRERDKASFITQENHKRLSEFYNMTLEVASAKYKFEGDIEAAEEKIAILKSDIKDLGNVNVDAIKEFEEISERFDELKNAENEIIETKVKIETAIKEMDSLIIEKMSSIINEINEEFNNVFRTMFGGGRAEVFYIDPSNPLESGIDIKAQPPGKSVNSLRLFSGGEKSLIAISLLFAILRARPLALCILDEVEAALDDANVVRYAEYLQKLKNKTQFLVITHRHGTMSRVDDLIGATMQTRGVTTFFSVKLSEAKKLVDNPPVTE